MERWIMKKILCLFCIFASCANLQSEASWGGGYKYIDAGAIYTETTTPKIVAKNVDIDNKEGLSTLKRGEASARNILQLIELGNASIDQAARNGKITKIHYVDTKTSKVYIPLGFIPIYAREIKTIVYGE